MDLHDFFDKLPDHVDKAKLAGLETCFHFDLGGSNPFQKTLSIANGELTIEKGLTGDPKCVISGDSDTLARILKKEMNPMSAFLTGKIKASNTGEILKFAGVLGLM